MLDISGQIMSANIPVVEVENGIVKSVNKELAPLFYQIIVIVSLSAANNV